jgi:hypothetical protein
MLSSQISINLELREESERLGEEVEVLKAEACDLKREAEKHISEMKLVT